DVRYDEYFLICQNFIGCRRSRAIRALRKNPALDTVGVPAGDLIFGRRRNKDFAFGKHQLSRIGPLSFREISDPANPLPVLPQRSHVDSILVIDRAVYLNYADDFVTRLRHKQGSVRTNITESLHNDSCVLGLQPQFPDGFIADDHDPASGGFPPSARSANIDRLARNY